MKYTKGAYHYPSSIDSLAFIKEREDSEVEKQIKIQLNGVVKEVTAIKKGGHNYAKLQDLRDDKIIVDYNGLQVIKVK